MITVELPLWPWPRAIVLDQTDTKSSPPHPGPRPPSWTILDPWVGIAFAPQMMRFLPVLQLGPLRITVTAAYGLVRVGSIDLFFGAIEPQKGGLTRFHR